jgi:hypothetical protein
MILIGISGKKRAGKDTVARFIGEWGQRHLWRVDRRGFADGLKQEVAAWLTCELIRAGWDTETAAARGLWAAYPPEAAKEKSRPLLQWWGGEFRRELFGEDYWLKKMDAWLQRPELYPSAHRIVVIPDVRMANEFDFVRQRGGLLIRVERSQVLTDWHASETALDGRDDWDWRIDNNAGLAELACQVQHFCAAKLEKRE